MTQESFLGNDVNKKNIIAMLIAEITAKGVAVKQSKEDADLMIVRTAIDKAAEFNSVVITGDDVILLSSISPQTNAFFQKNGRGSTPSLLYSAGSCTIANPRDILLLLSVSRCNTT